MGRQDGPIIAVAGDPQPFKGVTPTGEGAHEQQIAAGLNDPGIRLTTETGRRKDFRGRSGTCVVKE